MKNYLLSAFLLFFLTSVTFFGCETREKQTESKTAKGNVSLGGTIKVPISALPKQIEPSALMGLAPTVVGIHIYEGLVRLDPTTSKVVPGLAESWSLNEDESAYIFNLKKGVLFHQSELFGNGGRSVTANDVLYSLSKLAREANDDLFATTLKGRVAGAEEFRVGETENFEGVSVIDDYTLKIQLQKANQSFLNILTLPAFGVVPKQLAQNDEAGILGAGPFRFVSAEGELTLVKNTDYHDGDEFGNVYPFIDTLVFVPVKQNSDRLNAFFNNEIDIISNLELTPIRSVLELHVADFSGKQPKYVLKREVENASYETYTMYRSGIKHLGSGFMGYRDYSQVQIEQ